MTSLSRWVGPHTRDFWRLQAALLEMLDGYGGVDGGGINRLRCVESTGQRGSCWESPSIAKIHNRVEVAIISHTTVESVGGASRAVFAPHTHRSYEARPAARSKNRALGILLGVLVRVGWIRQRIG